MDLSQRLAEQSAQGLLRQHRVVEGPQQIHIKVDGVECINFTSNDYLGLANHPQVKAAFKAAVDQYGVGSGAAHLVSGHTKAHRQLEEELAAFTGRDRALLLSTGYMANIAVLSTLTDRHDVIYQDRLNHASLIDGGMMSRAKVSRYPHLDVNDLARRIKNEQPDGGIIATDALFSMDGDVAPLDQLADVAKTNGLMLVVDDAHGFGVLGDGRGSLADFDLDQDRVPVLMATLGKALGSFGAFVAGSDEIIESLIQFARSYLYTTAPPAAIAEAARASLRIVRGDVARRERLQNNIAYFRQQAHAQGLLLSDSSTAIQLLAMPDAASAMQVQAQMAAQGFMLSAIRPPTVATPRLRMTLCSEHQQQDIAAMLSALAETIASLKNE